MKNTFGNNVTITLFGESHGKAIGCVLDGIVPGVTIDEDFIKNQLSLRRPASQISTPRSEKDKFQILSGVFEGKTTGTPIAIVIPNEDTHSKDYDKVSSVARPGHADFTAEAKYHGFQDFRGGGHFSGRITAALVAGGAIAAMALKAKGIEIGTHIAEIGGIKDDAFGDLTKDIKALNQKEFAVLNDSKGEEIKEKILKVRAAGDSIGGILETAVVGLPAGVGEPWFDSVESMLSHALFSIPAVKGVEFGLGFGFATLKGSEANDVFYCENGKVSTKTNNNGGINGGITNGMPVIFKTVVKPTPTISLSQQTFDYKTLENSVIEGKGRHDPCIVHRARVVVDSVAAICLLDMLTGRFGTDWVVK